ncbi:hypothetical protein [Solicola sp. PLA-1-18]|uniref:hypothetical protein n=1 Tax=Solicola sp. PLA-1-18 TaxID=3380532 RepID=UPI003B78560E
MRSVPSWLARAWPWALSLLVTAPLLAPGYVLTYDMVWVPHLDPTRSDLWGLGSALPRAVPSDAVVALLGAVLPASLVQKLVLVLALGLAGEGARRLLRDAGSAAQVGATTFYVVNPFVAERLVLGQWPLLVAYAALPWLLRAGLALRAGAPGAWVPLGIAVLATALSPATGLMGALAVVVTQVGRGTAAARRWTVAVALVVGANAPWVLAGLVHVGSARSDPAAVDAFSLQPEAGVGRLGAALSLGGVWNTEVVPDSRTLAVAPVLVVLVWAVVLAGVGPARRASAPLVPLAVLGAAGLIVALAGWLVPDAVAAVVDAVPGGGLVRDGTRYLALLAPLQALLVGHALGALARRLRRAPRASRWVVVTVVALLPLVELPDLAWGVGGRLSPVAYPASWTQARQAVSDLDAPGDVLVLPFGSYRAPSWNRGRPVLDPAGRFFDRSTLVDDTLRVSGRPIAGEDPRAGRVGEALGRPGLAQTLAREGVGVVVVERDAGPVGLPADGLAALDPVLTGGDVDVYAVPGEVDVRRPAWGEVAAVAAGWALALLTLAAVAVGLVRRSASRRHPQHEAR